MKKRRILFLGISILLSNSAMSMDLNTALEAAYQNNDKLKAARQKFLAEIEAFPQALSKFLPDISANIKSTNSKQKTKGAYEPRNNVSTEVGPDLERSVTISQNIFSGGQSVQGLKSAQAGFYVQRSELYKSEGESLNAAIDAYLSVSEATEKYKIAIDSLEFHTKNLNMSKERLKVGESTVTDVALANSNVANAKATKSKQYADLISAKDKFKTVTGIDADSNMPFPSAPKDIPKSLDELNKYVMLANNEIIASKNELKKRNYDKKSALGSLSPTADISLQAGKTNLSPERSPRVSSRQNSLSYSTTVSVNIPIYSKGGSAYSSIRGSKKAERMAVHNLDHVEKSIKSRALSLWENYIAAKEMIEFRRKHVEYQKLALDGIKQEYEVGAKTMIDVLKSQEDFNKAKIEEVDSKKQYIQVTYAIKEIMGEMIAPKLKLKVKYFNPEREFRNIKHKIVGF